MAYDRDGQTKFSARNALANTKPVRKGAQFCIIDAVTSPNRPALPFVLRLLADKPNAAIPFNYPYLLTGWIYRVLADADQDYTRFLHERGYRPERHPGDRKTFRLFTFSDLRMHGYELRPREGRSRHSF